MGATKKRILFISGSFGLGHITRDLAIAAELRKQNPDLELLWWAAHPASLALKVAGETILSDDEYLPNVNFTAEQAASNSGFNIGKSMLKIWILWARSFLVLRKILKSQNFDLIIGDETYELYIAMVLKFIHLKAPLVSIFDFLGVDAMSGNILEQIPIYLCNLVWYQFDKKFTNGKNSVLFIGEPDDISTKKWGFLLPNRCEHAHTHYDFIGYVFQFKPIDFNDRLQIKSQLGYGPEPLVICSIGGTAIGKTLLDLCGQSYPIIKKKFPDLRMVLVCGPRLEPESLDIPSGPEVREYVPELYRHFAACDLAVVQGGGTSTLELTALNRPFLYFPIEGHCEQELSVAPRLVRHRAGVRMSYTKTTPESLAREIISNLGKDVDYAQVPINGAAKAARFIYTKLGQQIRV